MKRNILLTALLSLISLFSFAQYNQGNITVGMNGAQMVYPTGQTSFSYSTTNSPNNFFLNGPNQQYGYFTNDKFFVISPQNDYSVTISNNNQMDTHIWLFTYSNGINMITHGDGDDGISANLTAYQYYYVVVEGLYANGQINTNFSFSIKGDNRNTPVNAGSYSQGFNYTKVTNTYDFTNQYGLSTNDVFYKFTISKSMFVTMKHEGSTLNDTYMYLLDSSGNRITSNDDYSGEGHCTNTYHSYIKRYLAAGTYYVVSEGYSQNGLIKTNISGSIPPTGDALEYPINAGSFSSQFTYTNTANTNNYFNCYNGKNTKDVYHKIVITTPMNLTITHEGSSLSDTYMSILDSNGNLIVSNDDYSGAGHCTNTKNSFIQRHFNAGTYYVVSEGKTSDGIICLNVTGNTSNYGYSSIPSTYSTQSGTVGAMGGSFGVSSFGGATYTIPIEVPLGVDGMKPQISIAYNSQAGNGLCGYGVNLTGFSSITRGPKDLYHDNTAQGIKNLADDALYLDGIRLILSKGTAGQNLATYNPESDPFTKVIAHGTCDSNSNNIWFEVQSSDGMVYLYTTKLSYTKGDSQRIHSWYLTRAIQPTGNYVEYYYNNQPEGCFVYPILIAYGSNINQSNALSNTISFVYEDRDDVIPVYFDGKKGSFNKRLKTITCKTSEQVFRTYTLNYDTTGDETAYKYSRLTSVTEKNGQNESLPATNLAWSYLPAISYVANNLSVYEPTNLPSGSSFGFDAQNYISGDLNGDGISDIVGIGTLGDSTAAVKYYGGYSNNGSLKFQSISGKYSNLPKNDTILDLIFTFMTENSISDIDGNGINELIIPYFTGVPEDYGKIYYCVIGESYKEWYNFKLNRPSVPLFSSADIYNDGRNEMIALETEEYLTETAPYIGYRLHILKYNEQYGVKSDKIFVNRYKDLSFTSTPRRIFFDDFNKDGMEDLLVICDDRTKIYWNVGGTVLYSEQSVSYVTNLNYNNSSSISCGDFNGDGLTDIITKESTTTWYFYLNNGDGGFSKITAYDNNMQYPFVHLGPTTINTFDFDGDGKTDVVMTEPLFYITPPYGYPYFSQTITYWLRSNGTSLDPVYCATSSQSSDALNTRYLTGDFDGDGLIELVNYGYDCVNGNSSNSWRIYKNNALTVQTGKVVSIDGNYGATTNITYSTLADSSVYTRGTVGSYPAPRYTIPLNVVKQSVQSNGAVGDFSTQYSYEGLRIHLQGKGILGFNSTRANNTTMGTTVKTEITGWNNTYFVPSTTKTTTTLGGKTSQTQNTFAIVNKGGKKFFAYPSQIVQTDFDGNNVTTTRTCDDERGYLKNETVKYGTTLYKSIIYTDTVYAGNTYKPQTVITTQWHPDDTAPFSATTKYTYDIVTGKVKKVITNSGKSKELTTQYTYDIFGNQTSKEIRHGNVTDMKTFYAYDGTHRFPVRIYTNPSSSVQKFTYDIWGNVLTERDSINSSVNNEIQHDYDNWGNRIFTQVPGSGTVTYTRGWGSDSNKRFFVLEQGTSSPWVKTWYDNIGRVVLTESIGPKNVVISNTISYKDKGLKVVEEEKTGILSLSHTYIYDDRGRIEREEHPSNRVVTYSYSSNGLTTTITENPGNNENEKITTYWYDVMGNIKKVQGPMSNVVTYEYSSNGNTKKIVANGATWEMEYDDCGNQTKLIDPDAGTTQFTYDALGREIQRIDGRGVVYATNYDIFGRVTSRSADYDVIQYNYGTNGTGQLRLVSESNFLWTKNYEYDQYGRLTGEALDRGHGGFIRSKSYQYNAAGLLSSCSYPDDRKVSYTYDSYGNCATINAGTSSYNYLTWTLTGYNGKTMTSSVSAGGGNPYVRTTQLDDNGQLQSRVLKRQNTTLKSDNYTFDGQTGNLMSRTVNGVTQSFSYDKADRLTGVTTGQNQVNMSYSTNGNITSKSDIGQYNYNNTTRPHAVTDVDMGGSIPYQDQWLYYDNWNKVTEVEYSKGNDFYFYSLEYGPDLQRTISTLSGDDGMAYSKFNWDEYEEYYADGNTYIFYWIEAPDGLAGMLLYNSDDFYNPIRPYAAMTDHLGSLTALYDQYTTKVHEASYDAWGKRTSGQVSMPFVTRGFTGHEHLDELDLINMNGRFYDPNLGRFLSPDPFVQSPNNPQNFNRYSYCLNNPLKYTDPSGEIFFEAMAISAIIGGINGAVIGKKADAKGGKMLGYILGGAAIGALSTCVGQGLCTMYSHAVISGAGSGLISGLGNSLMTNWGKSSLTKSRVFEDAILGALTGSLGEAFGTAIGGGIGAFAGGAVATATSCYAYGGRGSDVALSALGGGLLSYGVYELASYGAWKSGGNKIGDFDITYKQYKTMQADMQRSIFWRREYGGILTTDGDVVRAPLKYRHNFTVDFEGEWTEVAKGRELTTYHTHWARPGKTFRVNADGTDIDLYSNTYGKASNGPSNSSDYPFAQANGMKNLLFDKTNSYVYWGEDGLMKCGRYFPMRYLPVYMFY